MDYLIFDGGEKSGQFLLNKNFIFHHQQHIPLLEFLNMPIIQIPRVDGICTIFFPYFSSTNFFCNGPILPPQNLNGPFLKRILLIFTGTSVANSPEPLGSTRQNHFSLTRLKKRIIKCVCDG